MSEELHPDLQSFDDNFKRGLDGKNLGIPTGFRRLSRYVGIRRGVYYLIGGYTGSAKTTLIDDVFVLHPSEWFLDNMGGTDIDLKILYFSMERKKEFKIAKWISRFIFLDTANIIPVDDILSWHRIASEEVGNLVQHKKMKINELLKNVIMLYEDPMTPTEINEVIEKFSEVRGHEEERWITQRDGRKELKKVWIPDNPSEVILIVTDHIGLVKNERIGGRILNDKETLDKFSSNMRKMRDYYNYSPVVVSQFNRDIANPMRIKNGDVEPMLEDFKGSGDSQEDAEVVMSLFDPMRYKVPDPSGYDLDKLRDEDKRKKYRSLKILKNSYGGDDIRVGLAFQPEIGMFKEMPRLAETTEEIYNSIIDNTYFLPEYGK
jgi:replicative DNA helicase